jgi:hypothetical protein
MAFTTRAHARAAGWRDPDPVADEPVYDLYDDVITFAYWVNPDGEESEPVVIENEQQQVQMYPPKKIRDACCTRWTYPIGKLLGDPRPIGP